MTDGMGFSLVPDEWRDPGSKEGAYYEVAWMAAAVLLFGAVVLVQPDPLESGITTGGLMTGALVGGPLGAGLTYLSAESDVLGRLESSALFRFGFVFGGFFLIAGPLRAYPTQVLLVAIMAALFAIPTRVAMYRRHR